MGISLLGIGLLHGMAGEQAIGVGSARGLHGGWAGSQLGKDGPVAILVLDVVALEYRSAFVLAPLVALVQFVVLFNQDTEDKADVDLPMLFASIAAHIRPVADPRFVPDAELAVWTLDSA